MLCEVGLWKAGLYPFIPHIKHLKDKCTKALNLLQVLAHTFWGADQETLLHLYRSLIRSKLDYGCIVYGFARGSYLRMLDPIQNHALVCAWVLTELLSLPVYAWKEMSPLSILGGKNFHSNCSNDFCP